MKKLLKLLLVRRQETNDKWWHRLSLVLIYGSTIVVAVFLAILLISEESDYWITQSYTAYSFEQGYENAAGEERGCSFRVSARISQSPRFLCGDIESNTEFLDRYTKARGTYERLQELRPSDTPNMGIYESAKERAESKTDEEIMAELIQSGELDNIKVKRTTSFKYAPFFGNWGVYILLVLVWLIFWESAVYRTILFIVYGKKNG